MTCAADLKPTTEEMDAALALTADSGSDADGVDRVKAAQRAVTAAEPGWPLPSAARAMIALARERVALSRGRDWPGVLAARNDLVDFINDTSRARPVDANVADLDLAGDYADEIENTISSDTTPASARTRLSLCLRLNDEGFEVGERIAALLGATAEAPPDEPDAPSFKETDATSRWAQVLSAFQEIEDEVQAATMAYDRIDGLPEDHHLRLESEAVHSAWRDGRAVLMQTPSPHWEALATKVRLIRGYFDCEGRWDKAAADFLVHAEKLGSADPAHADLIEVMSARGHAEQIAYFLANRKDGYAEWAANWTVVSKLAAEAELVIRESRDLASLRSDHQAMSGEIISAVWFSKPPKVECEVERLSDEWSTTIRTYHTLDGRPDLTDAEQAKMDAADSRLEQIREEVFEHLPRSRSGVAFQLLAAASLVPLVQGAGAAAERDRYSRCVVTAVANAIRALGLPFDYRAPPYFMGPQLSDLDGRDTGGVDR